MGPLSVCVVVLCVILLVGVTCVEGLRLTGVLPTSYESGMAVAVKVNSLTSVTKVMPMSWYSMPWCAPSVTQRKAYRRRRTLGEVLSGDEVEISLYEVSMLQNVTCREVCEGRVLSEAEQKLLTKRIEDQYRGNLILDGLPATEHGAARRRGSTPVVGFPLGVSRKVSRSGKTVVHNHLALQVQYHVDDSGVEAELYRVVGFRVQPLSVDHTKHACDGTFHAGTAVGSGSRVHSDDRKITWTYSVAWAESEIEWSTRWDVYLKASPAEARIHWVSLINSLLVMVVLTATVAVILIRALRRDLARYNDIDSIEEGREETGWKLVHGDVFRKPERSAALCVYVGTGMQLLGMSGVTLAIGCQGLLSPANRGSLGSALIFMFVLLGSCNGYTTARLAKMLKMKSWRIVFMSGVYFPGQMFVCYFVLNIVHWGSQASSATPVVTMLTLAGLWFCVSVPLVLVGGAVGYRQEALEFPRRVVAIPRTVPPLPWYLRYPQAALIPGLLPFGAAFIESVVILRSVWQGRLYYMFGFLGLVFAIVVVTCAEATVVVVYFQLVHLDYRWWWRSFLASGSYGMWLFVYSVYYYVTVLSIRSWWSSVLYFGYMAMVSYFFCVMMGTVGFVAALVFVRKIYGSIKVD